MSLAIASTVLSASLLFGQWLLSRGRRLGWAWLFGTQVPFSAYDVVTRQYGFLLMSAVGVWIYWHGWRHYGQS